MEENNPGDEAAKPSPDMQSELQAWNWGALVFTPLWLFRNGFLVTFVVYFCSGYLAQWIRFAISILFFFKGTAWSWGNGNRWNSFEQFADSQAVWNLVAKPCAFLIAAALAMLYAQGI